MLARAVLGDDCVAATVDHALRPESALEAEAASAFCENRGIPHATLRGALPERSSATANLSARARKLRYELLEQHATAIRARWIVTAHHADDQLETVVMRLNRASGIAGLAGIRTRNGRIVRPLLEWRRADLAAIVATSGVACVADPTNDDDRYDRARLRKVLARADWLDAGKVATSARALGEAEEAIEWASWWFEGQSSVMVDGELIMNPTLLPAELRRRVLKRCLLRLAPESIVRDDGLNRLLVTLDGGGTATLCGVRCSTSKVPGNDALALRWHFRPAPPRRAT